MKKIGVVGTRDGWSSEKLAETAARRGGAGTLVEMKDVRLDLDAGTAWYRNEDLAGFDALIIKKIGARYSRNLLDRLEVLRFLYEKGLKIFSSPLSIIRILDRISCTVTLKLGGIPLPPTTITENPDEALAAVGSYGEAVFKPIFTTKSRGMCLISAKDDPRSKIESYRQDNPIMYIQKKIGHDGRDLGVAFLGGRYLTTYARCNPDHNWSTSTAFGGKYEPYDPPEDIIEMARKAQGLFGLDFTSVDVVETDDGPRVFEVSAFGGFRGIQEARGIDVAQRYVDYVLSKLD